MGLLKEAGEKIFHYSEKLVSKTEEYSKIAKLNMDIKRFENTMGKIYNEIGEYAIKQIEQGKESMTLSDSFLKDKSERIKEIKENIEDKRKEIAEIKRLSEEKRKESGDSTSSTSS